MSPSELTAPLDLRLLSPPKGIGAVLGSVSGWGSLPALGTASSHPTQLLGIPSPLTP